MFDWCNRPRMLLLIGLLFGCSLFILLFGEYVEQNLITNQLFSRNIESSEPICPKNVDLATVTGKMTEMTVEVPLLLKKCQKCSDFEKNALQTVHCHPSGYFNSYACKTKNGTITVYRPCLSNSNGQGMANKRTTFYVFSIGAFLSTVTFWQFVRWRKELIETRAFGYQRLGMAGGGISGAGGSG